MKHVGELVLKMPLWVVSEQMTDIVAQILVTFETAVEATVFPYLFI